MPQIALVGLMVAGGALSAIGKISEANANADAAEFNAGQADRNAELTREKTTLDVDKERFKNRLQIGGIRAAYGASGLTMDGTPQEVLEQNQAIALKNEVAIQHSGAVEEQNYRTKAAQFRNAAGGIRAGGILGAIGGGASAAADILNRTA
jgi:hypothetical protein